MKGATFMKIIAKSKKNGHTFIIGTGTYSEVKALNIQKSFGKALEVLAQMRRTRRKFFDVAKSNQVNRTIYGTRKAG
jgi:hypothetical protein